MSFYALWPITKRHAAVFQGGKFGSKLSYGLRTICNWRASNPASRKPCQSAHSWPAGSFEPNADASPVPQPVDQIAMVLSRIGQAKHRAIPKVKNIQPVPADIYTNTIFLCYHFILSFLCSGVHVAPINCSRRRKEKVLTGWKTWSSLAMPQGSDVTHLPDPVLREGPDRG